ncbi:MAG: four helix bundle protein [Patescibacteria group bacterium]
MKEENLIRIKSFSFAVRIVKLSKYLRKDKREFILSKQILRSGTSIGANIEEAIGGQSRNDFASKISIAYKEARETRYWIELLKETDYLNLKQTQSLLTDCEEPLRIIGSIKKTTHNNS